MVRIDGQAVQALAQEAREGIPISLLLVQNLQ